MATTHIVDAYTASWDHAMNPTAPASGDRVRISDSADGRELDGFMRALRADGKRLSFSQWRPRLKMNEYVVEVGREADR